MADIITIVIILIIAYLWAARGFFSAFLHLVCCLIAAAVAFALWEPCTYFIMGLVDPKETPVIDLAWTLGLLVPFGLTIAVLRPIVDSIIRANLDFDTVTNMVGGGLCGVVTGFITCGVLVLALGYLPTKSSIVGLPYQPMEFEGNGSIVRQSNLVTRADTITANFFTMLADSTFFPDSGETLSKWRPNLADEGPILRLTFPPPEGGSRHVVGLNTDKVSTGKNFTVLSRYRVKDKNVLADTFHPERKQSYTYTAPGVQGAPATLEGVVVQFDSLAKETSGRIVVGAPQVRLIARNESEGRSIGIQPAAVISPADGTSGRLGRWRFDAPQTFISSVGGGDEAPMAFEFPVPAGYTPLAIVVKGMRAALPPANEVTEFAGVAARDAAVTSRSIASRKLVLDTASTPTIKWNPTQDNPYLRFSNGLPFGMMLQDGDLRGLVINDARKIIGGSGKFQAQDVQNRGIDRQLQVRNFDDGEDTAIMMVDMDSRNPEFGLMSTRVQSVENRDQPPVFVDEGGQVYTPIGYIFEGSNEVWFQFTPQTPIRSLTEDPMVRISPSTPANKITLIYRISRGAKLKHFAIGDKAVVTFKPTIDAPR